MRSSSTLHAFRLNPHEDLKQCILRTAREKNIKAGIILTCVGSLEQFNLRFANQQSGTLQNGFFEIVSLTGTFSGSSAHLHISVADNTGSVTGGHLLDGNLIYTTAEIVIAELTDLCFERETDPMYGYAELAIRKKE